MHPIINESLIIECWTSYPETKAALEDWLKVVKEQETLQDMLTLFPRHTFYTTDEKSIIFLFENKLALLAHFHEEGTVEIKKIRYKTLTLFPTLDTFHAPTQWSH